MAKKQVTAKTIETLKHEEATRKNIPTAEYQSVLQKAEQSPVRVAYERRNNLKRTRVMRSAGATRQVSTW